MQNKKIIFLASDCESSRWLYNAIKKEFVFAAIIIEKPVSRSFLLKKRIKKIGFFKVAGQVLFSLLAVPVLRWKARTRRAILLQESGLDGSNFPENSLKLSSVNEDACKEILQQTAPDIVIVNGTRIIRKKILTSTAALFINMHVGITPLYRGSHGGYWAINNNDIVNFGTTIHIVDAGVDTGAVLKQVFTKPSKDDNFTTYPVLQTIIGIHAMKEVLHQVIKNDYTSKPHFEKGKMYYQPAIWEYISGNAK